MLKALYLWDSALILQLWPECGFEVLTSLLGEDDNLDFKNFSSSFFAFTPCYTLCCLEVLNKNPFNKLSEDIRVQI